MDDCEPTMIDGEGRTEPPLATGEAATLIGFLEFQRQTLQWKCSGLDETQLATTVGVSTMTLGGLLKHLAYVEDRWFSRTLLGNAPAAPWNTVDWSQDPDGDWVTAQTDSSAQLWQLWRHAVQSSQRNVAHVLESNGLDFRGSLVGSDKRRPSLRWMLTHMIEEYARHNGHADLLREAIDGEVGE